jgi:hypothetical protein
MRLGGGGGERGYLLSRLQKEGQMTSLEPVDSGLFVQDLVDVRMCLNGFGLAGKPEQSR